MFAVIKTGGKQYRVAKDDRITVERLAGEAGDSVTIDQVLMVGGEKALLGAPLVDGASVVAEVVQQTRGDKIVVFKKKRRQGYRRMAGHRQLLTVIKVTDILTDGAKAKPAKKAEAAKPAPEAAAAPQAVEKPAAAAKAEAPAAEQPHYLDAPKGEADDLKKIGGVGPALEKKLNGLGIYHFWQIAEFTADDIAKVDDYLSFKGRIERDDWVGQAKTFAAEAGK